MDDTISCILWYALKNRDIKTISAIYFGCVEWS